MTALPESLKADFASTIAIIPTYNEIEEVTACIDSVLSDAPGIRIFVVNAGKPLPPEVAARVREIAVPDDFLWGMSIAEGMRRVGETDARFCCFINADVVLMPGTLPTLVAMTAKDEKVVACAPAYEQTPDGKTQILYTDQRKLGILLYGALNRRWKTPEEAPSEPFEVELMGGQCIVFSAKIIPHYPFDDKNFPHPGGDHDLWHRLRRDGYRLIVAPKTGVVNLRGFGTGRGGSRAGRLKGLKKKLTSVRSSESWIIMWRLRRKTMGLPLAIVSMALAFPIRWIHAFGNLLVRR